MALISVIVPVYKVEQYLSRCVDSILAQTFTDYELILVDDGSPDSCGDICDDYARKDGRIRVIHRENGGLSAARNSGLDWMYANSGSQWIAFADSDDWLHPEYLQRLYAAVAKTGARIGACGFFRTENGPFPELAEEIPELLGADDYYCSMEIHGGVTAVAWNKLYHRSLFEQLRYPEGKLHEDEFTTYHTVYASGSVAVIRAALYAYYQNPEGIMLSKWKPQRMHILEATEQQIAYAREQGNDRLLRKAAEQYIMAIHDHLQQAPGQFRQQLRKKLRSALKLGKECGVFLPTKDHLWAYEEAYPVKPLWWLYFRGQAIWNRRKEKSHG